MRFTRGGGAWDFGNGIMMGGGFGRGAHNGWVQNMISWIARDTLAVVMISYFAAFVFSLCKYYYCFFTILPTAVFSYLLYKSYAIEVENVIFKFK